jgi:hypothetical protein
VTVVQGKHDGKRFIGSDAIDLRHPALPHRIKPAMRTREAPAPVVAMRIRRDSR